MTSASLPLKRLDDPLIKPLHILEDKNSETLWQYFGPNGSKLPYTLQLNVSLNSRQIDQVSVEIGWLHRGFEKQAEATSYSALAQLANTLCVESPEPLYVACLMALDRLAEQTPSEDQTHRYAHALEMARFRHHLRTTYRLLEYAQLYKQLRLLQPLLDAPSLVPEHLAYLERHQAVFCNDSNVIQRLGGRGKLTRATALQYAITGPALKACGQGGSALERYQIRYQEMQTALKMVAYCAEHLQDLSSPPPARSAWVPPTSPRLIRVQVDGPEGELSVHMEHLQGEYPNRVRVKSPSFALASAIPHFLQGADIEDAVLILLSLGLSVEELDR